MDSLLGRGKEPKPPSDWDAIRAAKDRLKVSVNKKASTVSVSFESPSAEGSANILKHYLEEGKSRFRKKLSNERRKTRNSSRSRSAGRSMP